MNGHDAMVERTPQASLSARHVKRCRASDRAATIVTWSLAAVGLLALGFIIVVVLWRGLAIALDPRFLFGKPQALKAGGGIGPMLWSSFYLAGLTLAMALPIGIGAAIYMAEYAKEGRLTRLVRFGADSLSTVPSIVFGIFGLVLFVTYFGIGYSMLAGALTLSLLNLPTVMRTTEQALKSVPDTYREASMGLGATRWYTIKKVIMPSAIPGILTGAILTMGRIIGESAVIILTVGIYLSWYPLSPMQPGAPMAGNIWHLFTEGANISDYLRVAAGESAVLVLVVLALTLLARLISHLYRRKTTAGDRFV
jgi:phosphate transport system permease protein